MTRAVAAAGREARRDPPGRARARPHRPPRNALPALGVPVLCHPDEVQDAEGSGGFRYWDPHLASLPTPHRQLHRLLHRYAWDGGPVQISGTLVEGDEVAGFKVIELPGHAPGQIGLWRESDRLALSSDCFYTLDIWGRDCAPRLPLRGLQLRHRAGPGEHPQARGARAGGRMARPRQTGHRRRPRRSSSGPPTRASVGRRSRRERRRAGAEHGLHRPRRQRRSRCAAR